MTTTSAAAIVSEDLDTVVGDLSGELAQLAGKRLLVTGGAGFLGFYFVQAARRANEDASREPIRITVYDNYVRGVPAWLEELAGDEHLTLVEHDIRTPLPDDIEDFEYVVHAAGIASPTYYRRHPIETMDANVNGLRSLLDWSLRQGERGRPVEGFLYFSSSEIYGDPTPENIPTPETYRGNVSCTGPRACYDESKRYGETLCVNFAGQYGLPVRIARPFKNYGPGLKITDRRVIPDFARDILDGRDIVMLSDGLATRTFCYVSDAITGYYKVLVRGHDGEAYNVGVEEPEVSMAELAERLAELGRTYFGYEGRRRPPHERGARVPRRQPGEAPSRDHEGPPAPRLHAARRAGRRTEALAGLVRREPRVGGSLMRVAIVGLGYVGLVTGVCLAEKGHQVTGVDLDQERVCVVAAGRAPIFEEGLDVLLEHNVGERFRATSDLAAAVGEADLTMIAVGTPFDGITSTSARCGALRSRSARRSADARTTPWWWSRAPSYQAPPATSSPPSSRRRRSGPGA